MTPLQQASRNLITQLEGDSVWANYPWVTPKIAELRKALVDEQAQQVAVPSWKAEQIDEFEIRVTSPEGESWRLRSADRNDIFNNFIWRWAQAMIKGEVQ